MYNINYNKAIKIVISLLCISFIVCFLSTVGLLDYCDLILCTTTAFFSTFYCHGSIIVLILLNAGSHQCISMLEKVLAR